MKTANDAQNYGQIYQGDIVLMRVPDNMEIDTTNEISPEDGRLVLAEGEFTGHHHAIDVASRGPSKAKAKTASTGVAKLYRDQRALQELVRRGVLITDRLGIGFLVVTDAAVLLRHEEHDSLRVDVGVYYIGGQREMDASEERRVKD